LTPKPALISRQNIIDKPCRNGALCGNLMRKVFRTCWWVMCAFPPTGIATPWTCRETRGFPERGRHLERAVAELRKKEEVPDILLSDLSPLGWEHMNLTGDYVWAAEQGMSETLDGLR